MIVLCVPATSVLRFIQTAELLSRVLELKGEIVGVGPTWEEVFLELVLPGGCSALVLEVGRDDREAEVDNKEAE